MRNSTNANFITEIECQTSALIEKGIKPEYLFIGTLTFIQLRKEVYRKYGETPKTIKIEGIEIPTILKYEDMEIIEINKDNFLRLA